MRRLRARSGGIARGAGALAVAGCSWLGPSCVVPGDDAGARTEPGPGRPPPSRFDGLYFGRLACTVGDIDGDGVADYAAGLGASHGRRGALRCFSARTGAALFDVVGRTPFDDLGSEGFWPLADVDSDGLDDLALGTGTFGAPSAVVSLGRRGILGMVEAAPCELLAADDSDGDGLRALLRCTPEWVSRHARPEPGAAAPRPCAAMAGMFPARLVDRHGGSRPVGIALGGDAHALVFDPAHSLSTPILSLALVEPAIGLLRDVRLRGRDAGSCLCDLDGDSRPDAIAWRRIKGILPPNTDRFTHVLTAVGSSRGAILFERSWPASLDAVPFMANALASPGDLDDDGVPDIVVCDPRQPISDIGGVRAISGVDGSVLWTITEPDFVGVTIDVLDDLDGDGARELIIGCGTYSYDSSQDDLGLVLVVRGRTGSVIRRHEEADQPLAMPQAAGDARPPLLQR